MSEPEQKPQGSKTLEEVVKERRAACIKEFNAFMDEVDKGESNPVDILIIYQDQNGTMGMRANDGSSAVQVFLLECAKAHILGKAGHA